MASVEIGVELEVWVCDPSGQELTPRLGLRHGGREVPSGMVRVTFAQAEVCVRMADIERFLAAVKSGDPAPEPDSAVALHLHIGGEAELAQLRDRLVLRCGPGSVSKREGQD